MPISPDQIRNANGLIYKMGNYSRLREAVREGRFTVWSTLDGSKYRTQYREDLAHYIPEDGLGRVAALIEIELASAAKADCRLLKELGVDVSSLDPN